MLIPPHLRERARLERDLLWAGMGKNVELWSKDEWERALDISPDDEQAYQRAVEQFPL